MDSQSIGPSWAPKSLINCNAIRPSFRHICTEQLGHCSQAHDAQVRSCGVCVLLSHKRLLAASVSRGDDADTHTGHSQKPSMVCNQTDRQTDRQSGQRHKLKATDHLTDALMRRRTAPVKLTLPWCPTKTDKRVPKHRHEGKH